MPPERGIPFERSEWRRVYGKFYPSTTTTARTGQTSRDELKSLTLSQQEIDLMADACVAIVDEHARFLDDDVRAVLAGALRAMGKPREAAAIDT
jgi:hypothetical protein